MPGCKIYLLGSRARQDHDQGADIDLALDMGKAIERKVLALIQEKIEETTIPLCVDVIDLFTASQVFKDEVKNEGILWES